MNAWPELGYASWSDTLDTVHMVVQNSIGLALAVLLSLPALAGRNVYRTLIFLPPAEGLKLMQRLGERPGAEVLGVVLTHNEATPRMLIIFAKSRDARGMPEVELVGWDEAPAARSYIEELLLARDKSGSGTDFR